jgi:hypothetical protein
MSRTASSICRICIRIAALTTQRNASGAIPPAAACCIVMVAMLDIMETVALYRTTSLSVSGTKASGVRTKASPVSSCSTVASTGLALMGDCHVPGG